MSTTIAIAALATLIFLGLGFEEIFRRTGIPDVLLLLAVGFALRATGLVHPESIRGLEQIFTTIALVVVLFEGAIRVRGSELRSALWPTLLLTLATFALTVAAFAALGVVVFAMRPIAAILLGAILGCSSPTVIVPLVQNLKLDPRTRTALVIESALADVLSIVLTLQLVSADAAGAFSWGGFGMRLVLSLSGASIIGLAGGAAWLFGLRALRRARPTLVVTVAAVLLVYAVAEAVGTSGAIAALAFGLVFANAGAISRRFEITGDLGFSQVEDLFHRDVAFVLKVFFFVYLGIALRLDGYEPVVFGGVATLALIALRPFAVRIAFPRATTSRRDARLASVLVPKGIAAAILASIPLEAGVREGTAIQATAVGVILFSIVLASVLAFAEDTPFVAEAYDRLFSGYLEPDRADVFRRRPEVIRSPPT